MAIAKKTGLLAAGCIVAAAMIASPLFAAAEWPDACAPEAARARDAAMEQAKLDYQKSHGGDLDAVYTTSQSANFTLFLEDGPTAAPSATTHPTEFDPTAVKIPDDKERAVLQGILDKVSAPTTAPATAADAPTTAPVAAAVTVDSVLKDVDTAYAKLKSATFEGKITGHFEVGSITRDNPAVEFKTSFTAPNKFRHDASDILITSDGTKLFSFLKERSAYQTMTPPKGRAASADWPPAAVSILSQQDPSLLLAITPSAAAELKLLSAEIKLEPPVEGSGPTLTFVGTDDKPTVTMTFDPQTMLLRTAVFDFKKVMTKAGTADVKVAKATVTYPVIKVGAPVDPQQFAWAAPLDAAEVSTASTELDAGDDSGGFAELVGKPAPDFTLNDLKGSPVKLSSLKGSVVVLDLWATWCGPCKASLPDLDKMNTELSPKGLKFYAIDLQEDQPTIEKLLKTTGWNFPVLLDTDGAVAKKYKCKGIPQTMVIGKDGTLKKVFVGMGNDKAIETLVKKEMGG
jgi:peroxiredoxin